MLRPSPERAVYRYAAILAAVLAVALSAYFVLGEGPKASPSAGSQSAKPSAKRGARATDPDSVAERPARPRPRGPESAPSPRPPPAEGERDRDPSEDGSPAVLAVLAARDDETPAGTQALIASLASPDSVVVSEAARALVARRATEAIGPLAGIDLEKAAGSGLSIIDALGRLAGVAEEPDRSQAVDRLIAMLAEEKGRGARESPGNLIQIYEALGQTRDPRAAAPLEAELLDATVPRAPKVVIVASLVTLAQPSSHAALETQRGVERAAHESDAFEEEIRVELVDAIEAALKVI